MHENDFLTDQICWTLVGLHAVIQNDSMVLRGVNGQEEKGSKLKNREKSLKNRDKSNFIYFFCKNTQKMTKIQFFR